MRTQLQPAFVLHQRPYRDTSRILELFTRDFGRVTVFARGSRATNKSGNTLNSVLQPFSRLLISWSGKGEAGQLTGAEFDGPMDPLPPDRLVSAFYLNELLLKLFARHDAHADVFDLYSWALDGLRSRPDPLPVLRVFEKRLLEALGYGLALDRDVRSGAPVELNATYHWFESGPVRAGDIAEGTMVFSGQTLLALAREDLNDARTCSEARRLLRHALDRVLDGRELKSREVMLALRRREP
ncbi:MAG TPA: DNA repair protein RecO [Steroidobacteraceae bacterium]|nr:DNA repair protein RecO [Steroidobacteraceae bacterium]